MDEPSRRWEPRGARCANRGMPAGFGPAVGSCGTSRPTSSRGDGRGTSTSPRDLSRHPAAGRGCAGPRSCCHGRSRAPSSHAFVSRTDRHAGAIARGGEYGRGSHTEEPAEARTRLTDLGSLADEAAAAERVTYEGRLDVEPHAEPVLVCVNQVDVRGIISNLLSNATRAAGPGGAVTLEISRDSDLAQLVVEDTGPGFGQVPDGTGLGWRILARSLAACEGKISYGRGTLGGVRVSFWLPLAAA